MAKQILYVKSSVFGDDGVSSQLSRKLLEQLQRDDTASEVTVRDLVEQPLPHLSLDYLNALGAEPGERNTEQKELVAMGDKVIDEVSAADVIVVAAPMYNFSVPSTLKAWIDYLARAGATFRYTDSGPQGLLSGKRVFIVTTRGGQHRGQDSDVETPYLKNYFNFLGLDDIEFIFAEGLNMAQREEGIKAAREHIEAI